MTHFRPSQLTRRIARCTALALVVMLTAPVLFTGPLANAGDLDRIEDEFERAIKKVTPATVVCMPRGLERNQRLAGPPSSGVIVSRKGLVLSDGDAGVYITGKGRSTKPGWSDKIEIRIPHLKGKGFQGYEATVVHRDRERDTTLIRIESRRSSFPYLEIGDSNSLEVGDFNFVMGNSFGLAAEAPPTITAGVISALAPFEKPKREGAFETIYTSAAVNPGVNGGPIVDVDGRLIGTVGTFVGPSEKYQSLGKCVPVERLRAAYAKLPECKEIFTDKRPSRSRSRLSAKLETVMRYTGRRAFGGVVSFDVKRKGELSRLAPGGRGNVQLPRYEGAMSGVLIDDKGHILTALYNLTNVASLAQPAWAPRAPYDAQVGPGVEAITGIRVHWADGSSTPAAVTGYSKYLGVAMIKADIATLPAGVRPVPPAPASAYRAGRFVLALGNPFGATRPGDPLLAFGVLSKQHGDAIEDAWAGQWQTDAGLTDGNTGGAAVNLRGELIGILNMWSPLLHGRNSGIGFIAPWNRIEPHLEALKTGRKAPFLGVGWKPAPYGAGMILTGVDATRPAGLAGLKAGDRVLAIGGRKISGTGDALAAMRDHWAGDKVAVCYQRGDDERTTEVTLGARPGPKKPPSADDPDEKPADKPKKPADKPKKKPDPKPDKSREIDPDSSRPGSGK